MFAGFRRNLSSSWLLSSSAVCAALHYQFQDSSAKCELKTEPNTADKDHVKMIFLGTGSSTGCPKPLCPMVFQPTARIKSSKTNKLSDEQKQLFDRCKVSNLAIMGDPKTNKNYRNNPSFLIQKWDEDEQTFRNIVIDVGKTFREGALRWFPEYEIESLDAIVITHHHMDAAGGTDDIRNFQHLDMEEYRDSGRLKRIPTPVYLSKFCLINLRGQFPWLFPSPEQAMIKQDESKPAVRRDVASFDVQIFQDYQTVTVQGLDIIPLPVWHGDDLISHGFAFSVPSKNGKLTNVVYLSDISRMVPETLEFIQKKLPSTDILIVDALLLEGNNPVHFNLEQAMELRDQIQPKGQTYLVGMSCDAFPPHGETNEYLKKTFGPVQLAHDGLVIDLDQAEER
jgi:phosphoribosyl 1,2-cyclic phosphodiesterase